MGVKFIDSMKEKSIEWFRVVVLLIGALKIVKNYDSIKLLK
jgi:hypothetical protein